MRRPGRWTQRAANGKMQGMAKTSVPNVDRLLPVFFALCLLAGSAARAEAPATAEQTRQAFLKIIDRPKVDLAPEQKEQRRKDGLVQFHFSYASEVGQRVPGILLMNETFLTDKNRHPVVIVLHGTGGKKESEISWLKRFAEKGFIGVAIDGRFHGERGTYADYNNAISQAFTDGKSHPFYYDTVWDVLRLVDYLQSRADVDGQRIGLMGISKGGIETWLASAVDPRIAAAVPCIGVQSFEWALENDGWHARIGTVKAGFTAAAKSVGIDNPDAEFVRRFYDHLIPGIYNQFDGPAMLPLIAPRPLLVISGEMDPNNPLPGVRLCEEAAKPAYAKANAADHFQIIVEMKTGHGVTAEAQTAAVDWFVKWIGK